MWCLFLLLFARKVVLPGSDWYTKGSFVLGLDAKGMIWVDDDSEAHLDVPHPKISDLAVRYSFVTPFPTLRAILEENEKEADEGEKEQSNGEEEASPEAERPELEIYAGISGGIQHLFNEMELEFEEGETELRKVTSPPFILRIWCR